MKTAKGPFYKVLRYRSRRAPIISFFVWPQPGVYTEPVKGKLKMCLNGYHLYTKQ